MTCCLSSISKSIRIWASNIFSQFASDAKQTFSWTWMRPIEHLKFGDFWNMTAQCMYNTLMKKRLIFDETISLHCSAVFVRVIFESGAMLDGWDQTHYGFRWAESQSNTIFSSEMGASLRGHRGKLPSHIGCSILIKRTQKAKNDAFESIECGNGMRVWLDAAESQRSWFLFSLTFYLHTIRSNAFTASSTQWTTKDANIYISKGAAQISTNKWVQIS